MDMIGSGKLSIDNLPKERRAILAGIEAQIQKFRGNAEREEKECASKDKIRDKERPNNVISILGGRGSGKTSVALTIYNSLRNNNSEKNLDSILNIIDPSKFNVEDNALGWIIYSFENDIEKWKKDNSQNINYCNDIKNDGLYTKYEELKTNYIHSRKFYRENLSAITESRYEYDKINEKISSADRNLEKSFREFIEELCNVKRGSCKSSDDSGINEPMIFITFDDVDLCPEKGPEILELILNYLSHPNIVCIVLGDYATFSESLIIDLWKKSNIPSQLEKDTKANNNNTIFNNIVRRADDILGKVLPYKYRFELKDLELMDRLHFTPFGKGKMPKLYELIDKILIIEVNKGKSDEQTTGEYEKSSLLKYFIEPLIDVSSIVKKIEELNLDKNETRRPYDGYHLDVADNNSYNELILKLQNSSEHRKDLKELKAFDYAYILSGNPRGLINLYYKLEEICDGLDKPKLQVVSSTSSKFFGYGDYQEIYLNNYNMYTKLFEAFYNSNIELVNNNDGFDIRDILKLNKNHSTLEINGNRLILTGSDYYEYFNFNVSTSLLTISALKENRKMEKLNKDKCAFIQLFYDLAKVFLGSKIKEDEKTWSFKNICIYKRSEDYISYNSIDFKYFYDFYYFQRLYKVCLPLIIRDRKVHADIRNRLKAVALSIIKAISADEVKEKSRFIEGIFNINKLDYYLISDIRDKLNTINTIAENYSERGIGIFFDHENTDNIVHEILESQEQEYYRVRGLEEILKTSRYHLVCNEILTASDNSKKSVSQRCREIKDIVNSLRNDEVFGDGTFNEILTYAESEDWQNMRKELVKINTIIAEYLTYKIQTSGNSITSEKAVELIQSIKEVNQKFYNRINKNKSVEPVIGLAEYTELQDKLNSVINNSEIPLISNDSLSESRILEPIIVNKKSKLSEQFILKPVIVNRNKKSKLDEPGKIEFMVSEFLRRSVIREPFKENAIGVLKQVTSDEEVVNICKDIDKNNFKEKMYGISKILIGRWYRIGNMDKINLLKEVATPDNEEFISTYENELLVL
ncbi:hypothetical protein [Clostridium cellulovorans]|uniref:Uncharacterized protein n=1 Tax=Clostridium cellulovorans (strain ATCC 35296 / DSM 3052 / OCM 3 / 743B) TaxID=573061 RepID=D9STC7_CLOC7|nr:hypothetical protein [Clostridium cellulovorans]ADL50743.1 hypothetical protein Clocel_0977 [Clostridium cellulovorans 743B]